MRGPDLTILLGSFRLKEDLFVKQKMVEIVSDIPLYIDLHPGLPFHNVVEVLFACRLVEFNNEYREDIPLGLAQPMGRVLQKLFDGF